MPSVLTREAGLAQVDVVDRWGRTPLSESLAHGHLEIASMLVESGASLAPNQFSLVREAAENDAGKLELMCLRAGVHANSCDYDARTVLHTSCATGNLKAVKSLLRIGADVNIQDR